MMVKDTCLVTHKGKVRSPHIFDLEIPRMESPERDHLTRGTQAHNQSTTTNIYYECIE
jgi:hypothetical protein